MTGGAGWGFVITLSWACLHGLLHAKRSPQQQGLYPHLEPHKDQHPVAALGVVPRPQLQASFLQVQPGAVLGDAVVVLCVGDELQRQQGDCQPQGIGEDLGRGEMRGGTVKVFGQSGSRLWPRICWSKDKAAPRGWDCITKDLQGEDPAGQTQDSRAVARQQRGTHKRGAWLWTAQRVVVRGIPQACGYHMVPGPHLPAAQPDWLLQLRRKAVERQDRASDVERRVGDVRPKVQQVVAGKGLVLLYASLCVGRCAEGGGAGGGRQALRGVLSKPGRGQAAHYAVGIEVAGTPTRRLAAAVCMVTTCTLR